MMKIELKGNEVERVVLTSKDVMYLCENGLVQFCKAFLPPPDGTEDQDEAPDSAQYYTQFLYTDVPIYLKEDVQLDEHIWKEVVTIRNEKFEISVR